MVSLSNDTKRHMTWAVGASLALAVGAALADAPKANAPTANDNGVMTFPNVRVINAPIQTSTVTAAADSAMRAYVDPSTRKLRAQTPEEAQEIAAASKAKIAAKAAAAKTRSLKSAAATSDEDTGQMIYGPGNTVGMALSDEFMVYQLARKQDQIVIQGEVTGKSAADAALKNARKSDAKENSNER